MRFSKITGNFYPEDTEYSTLPPDIVTVSQEDYERAMGRAIGETLDVVNGSIVIVPVPAPTASEIKTVKLEAIKGERDRRIQTGGYKVGAKWFHSDTFSRTQQMGLVMLGANIPANTPWKTMDGTAVVMTQALAGQIFATAAASDIAIFAAAETHKAAMEAAVDPSAYDFSGSWPQTYAESIAPA
ncbi:hypothetical protein SKTS_33300 [Sulfurimicrobium lacus]|uniref:DUF4376 domain-containing protein n=1 Tax=Sulfurimicrobium lacus TaxID=2715678 RepID=A0A6F8VFI9_9PROT|nr:DUF4376 domain-containing protein [Sulfurimicrobium lacus]BCB28444.1 hypothetical protein SKTS_33300 [Sulfurimicrobium lacus]